MVDGTHEPAVPCRTVDVSLGGALLETPVLLGDEVVVVLVLDGTGDSRRLIPIAGDIVSQSLDAEAGVVLARIAFRRMTAGARERLSAMLTEATV